MRRPLVFVAFLFCACGANTWSYSRSYQALDGEDAYLKRQVPMGYEELRRYPDRVGAGVVGWFGVVLSIEALPEAIDPAFQKVLLSIRSHQPRHLCHNETEGSCRVTVSNREVGQAWVVLRGVQPEQLQGRDGIKVGTLLKIYAERMNPQLDEQGRPTLSADWFRHFPVGRYVTTRLATHMRQ